MIKTRYTDHSNLRLRVCEHQEPTVLDALNWLGSLPFISGPNGPLSVKEILLDGVWRRDLFTVCDELGLVALTRRDGALFSGAARSMSIYAAILDGGVYAIRQSIQAAEEDAAWLRRNPARTDRVRFGNGGDVYVAELIEDEFGVDDYVVVGGPRDGAIVNGCPARRPH